MKQMRNVRVRIYLSTPCLFWQASPLAPLHLDGIIAYALLTKRGLKDSVNLVRPDLPFEVVTDSEGRQYHAASAMFTPKDAQWRTECIAKSASWQDALYSVGIENMTYDTKRGWARSYVESFWSLVTPYLDFYAVADMNALLSALNDFMAVSGALGSKTSIGYGKVHHIEVSIVTDNYSLYKDGQPTRNIPVCGDINESLPVIVAGYTFPYWHPSTQCLCYTPALTQWAGSEVFTIPTLVDKEEAK